MKTGSGAEGGGEISSGVVTRGGNGCTQLRLTFFGGGPAVYQPPAGPLR